MPRVDWRAVGAGAALAFAVLAVTMVVVQVVDASVGLGRDSNLVLVFYVVALGGEAAGGWLAASRRPDAGLAHGLLAALSAYAVVALFGATLRLTVDKGPDPVALAFNGLMAACAGIVGTVVADRWPRSRPLR
ncbi:MAG: hypothetical protein ACRD2W_03315 [Acidimicrobiales bacterium]